MTPYEELDELYATIPKIDCKKRCGFTNCGPLQLTQIELRRMEDKVGIVRTVDRQDWQNKQNFGFEYLPYHPKENDFYRAMEFMDPDRNGDCQFLMPVIGTCRLYGIRPLICRLWGVVNHPAMRCKFGCVPERWITSEEGRKYFEKVIEIQDRARKGEKHDERSGND